MVSACPPVASPSPRSCGLLPETNKVFIFVLLTLSSKSLDDIGKLDSLLAAEWVISFGTLAMSRGCIEDSAR